MRIVGNSGTPLYAAAFANDDIVVVGGGGGQGSHGVTNKLVSYRIDSKLTRVDELELPPDSDSPTSMAGSTNEIWVGVNIPRSGKKVDHLSKVKVRDDGKLELQKTFNHFKTNDVTIYQKSTSVAGHMVASASSGVPAIVTVFNSADGDLATMKFGKEELIGAAIADYDESMRYVAAATSSSIEIRAISNPGGALAQLNAPTGEKWSRIASIGPGRFVAASTLGTRQGASLTIFEIYLENGESHLKKFQFKLPGFKGVTALHTSGSRVAVASPGGDILLYSIAGIRAPELVAKLRKVHKFPVTALALSPDGTSVVSTSLDGSIVLTTGLGLSRVSLRATVGWATLSVIIIAILAICLSYTIELGDVDGIGNKFGIGKLAQAPKFVSVHLERRPGFGRGPVVNPLSARGSYRITEDDETDLGSETATEWPSSTVWATAPRPTAGTLEAEIRDVGETSEKHDNKEHPPVSAEAHGDL